MMNEKIKLIESALKDPVVKGMKVLSPASIDLIVGLLESDKTDFYLGEWKSELGRINYEYRVHPKETGDALRKILDDDYKFNKPSLTSLYSRKDLSDYVQDIKKAA